MSRILQALPLLFAGALFSLPAHAAEHLVTLAGIPLDFFLFGATLLGVALFHHHTLRVALTGAITLSFYKILFTGFKHGEGISGLAAHMGHEWVMLANLLCLLMGFALLSRHFEKSHLPVILPRWLPHGWQGGFVLLVLVFIMSGCLDNIAAALIGGAIAHQIFRAKVHIGYLAAIVAIANAGGAGSVLGDTTTTMLWISGTSPLHVMPAYLGALVALVIVGIIASRQQQAYSPMLEHTHEHTHVDWPRLLIVGLMLAGAISTNVVVNIASPALADHFPFIGVALWVVLFATAGLRRHDWEVLPETFKGAVFLMSLVVCASMMPVEDLPTPSAITTFALGLISSVFDNIPLTALAIKQGGYDQGFLAYAVGFGGSMVWFGSSAGVALTNMFPEGRSVWNWISKGWHVILGYAGGYLAMFLLLGWNP